MDEKAIGACCQLVFAPIDELFPDDAPLLPSGFRVIPLDVKNVSPDLVDPQRVRCGFFRAPIILNLTVNPGSFTDESLFYVVILFLKSPIFYGIRMARRPPVRWIWLPFLRTVLPAALPEMPPLRLTASAPFC